jgi:hypothetical protein
MFILHCGELVGRSREFQLFANAMQDVEVHLEDRGVGRSFFKCVDRTFEQSGECSFIERCIPGQMREHLRLVDGCKYEHVSKLSVHRSKDIGQHKSLCARALVSFIATVLWRTNAVESDGTSDGSIDAHTCKLDHLVLASIRINHMCTSACIHGFSSIHRRTVLGPVRSLVEQLVGRWPFTFDGEL